MNDNEAGSQIKNTVNTTPSGVGGWLLLLIVGMMFLGPLLGVAKINGEIMMVEQQNPDIINFDKWITLKNASWFTVSITAMLSFYGGFGLVRGRNELVVKKAKIILWIIGPISVIIMMAIIPTIIFSYENINSQFFGLLIVHIAIAGAWTAYLSKSKRVKNTYKKPKIVVNNNKNKIESKVFKTPDNNKEELKNKEESKTVSEPLPIDKKSCPHCGSIIDKGAIFCSQCYQSASIKNILINDNNNKEEPNKDTYKNALIAIEYRPEAKSAFDSLKNLPEQYRTKFLDLLEENPKGSVDEYHDIIMKEYTAWLKPYENEKTNIVLQEVRKLGESAEKEFIETVNILGDSVDPSEILAKIKKKLKEENTRYLNMNPQDALDDICNRYNMTSEELKNHLGIEYLNGSYYYNNHKYKSFIDAVIIADNPYKNNNVFVSKEEVKDNLIGNENKLPKQNQTEPSDSDSFMNALLVLLILFILPIIILFVSRLI